MLGRVISNDSSARCGWRGTTASSGTHDLEVADVLVVVARVILLAVRRACDGYAKRRHATRAQRTCSARSARLILGGRAGVRVPARQKEEGIVLTIIQSGSKAWAVAATNGDVRIFSREQVGEWIEVLLSEDSEQIDGDGSLLLEALYEQHAGGEPEEDEEPEAEEEDEEPEAEEEDEEPEAEEEAEEPEPAEEDEPEAAEDEEPEEEEEEKKPRRSRGRTRAKKK
jgi:hypothetical protein